LSKESKHVAAFRERQLKPAEQVLISVEGYIGDMMGSGKNRQHNGALIVTDQRVAFYRKGVLGEVFQAIPLGKVTSVEKQSTMGHTTLTLHTSHDDLSFKTFKKDDLEPALAAIEEGRDSATPPPRSAEGVQAADPLAMLQKLSDLHSSGVLTKEEYESKKREILSRM
jgi:hypothetical protein